MIQIEQIEYIRISKEFTNKPFEITNSWVEYQKVKGNRMLFFVDSISQPQILCWTEIKKVRFIGEILKVYGPIYKSNVTSKHLYKFLNCFKDLSYEGFVLSLGTIYDVTLEIACRKALFKRPIGQSYSNLTIIINTDKFNPDTNWKRNIKIANKENFSCKIKKSLSFADCLVIESLHAENAKTKGLNYRLKAEEISVLTEQSNIYTCFLYKDEKSIAARIISIEENVSYDIFACNSIESRNGGATQYIMNYIFDFLKEKNISYFDFSRIPLGKKESHGVYEFKNASRGDIVSYNGEWVLFKNNKLRHLFYLFNLLVYRKDFY